MSDEFAQWNNLARLWHVESAAVSTADIELHARRQRQGLLALAVAEASGFALVFIGAVWISMHTAMVAMSALTIVFFATCGFLQHRMRREPPSSGGDDLLSSLEVSIAREEWNLAQLGIGRDFPHVLRDRDGCLEPPAFPRQHSGRAIVVARGHRADRVRRADVEHFPDSPREGAKVASRVLCSAAARWT
jgi:hypothetical protein